MLSGSLFQRACRVHPRELPITFERDFPAAAKRLIDRNILQDRSVEAGSEEAADGIVAGLDQPASAG